MTDSPDEVARRLDERWSDRLRTRFKERAIFKDSVTMIQGWAIPPELPDVMDAPERPSGDLSARASRPASTRRCNCGRCWICLDNARWERIFQEKFADPNYYTGLPIRHRSALCDFEGTTLI